MERRHLLRSIGIVGGGYLAGCLSTDEPSAAEETTVSDTDGDGIPDRHDYAPRDPSVQSKSDVQRTTSRTRTVTTTEMTAGPQSPLATATPTPIPIPTPTTTRRPPTTTSTPSARNSLLVDLTAVEGQVHHFVEYSLQEATVQIYAELLDASYPGGAKVAIVSSSYPSVLSSGRTFDYAESGVISNATQSDTRITVALDFDPPDEPFYLWAILLPAGKEIDEVTSADMDTLCQTDRLTVENSTLRRRPFKELESIRQDTFERINVEGCYLLNFAGRTFGRRWDAGFVANKSGYVEKALVVRHYDYADYVRMALSDGTADALGSILDEEAERNGISGDQEKVEFLIDFVQGLPYVPDDVSAGVDEYPKYLLESVVEAGGDCEDSSILLASLLLSSTFGYGTVLISPPEHMAVGVKGDESVEGSYYEYDGNRYYYVETTGSGWGIGEIPAEYQNERATIYSI